MMKTLGLLIVMGLVGTPAALAQKVTIVTKLGKKWQKILAGKGE